MIHDDTKESEYYQIYDTIGYDGTYYLLPEMRIYRIVSRDNNRRKRKSSSGSFSIDKKVSTYLSKFTVVNLFYFYYLIYYLCTSKLYRIVLFLSFNISGQFSEKNNSAGSLV